MSLARLEEISQTFEMSDDRIKTNEDNRQAFIHKFPLDKLHSLTLEQYAQGTNKDSFCYWLEFKDAVFGIGGGNASKFGIYKAKEGQYYRGSGKSKEELTELAAKSHFETIRDCILQALDLIKQDRPEDIRTLHTPMWKMVLQKILSMYFPEKFLTIGAPDVIIECARDINIEGAELEPDNSILVNYLCKQKLDKQETFKDWDYFKLGQFIYNIYEEDSKREYYIIGSKYGENADIDVFPQMLQRSVVSTGFASHYDLTGYYGQNYADIIKYLKEQGEDSNSYSTLKYFLNLKKGDRIAVKASGSPKGNQGFLSVVGIAEVCERNGKIYEHDPNGLGHIVHVNFLQAPIYEEFDLGGYGRTLHKLAKPNHIDIIFKSEHKSSRLERFKRWLEGVYKQSNGLSLSDRSVSSYMSGIKLIEREINKRALSKIPLFNIDDVQALKDLKNKYFAVPDIKEKDDKGKQMDSNAFQRYVEFMVNETVSRPTPTSPKAEKLMIPLNTILYGPPGTGKTYKLRSEYFKLFTDEQSTQTLEEYCLELVNDMAWWEVISVIVLDLKSSSVKQIYEHPLLKAKNSISLNKTPKNTIWSLLQWHTKDECPYVKFEKRKSPQFFWKGEGGEWTIDEGIVKAETPELYIVLENYRNYKPIHKTEERYVFTTFHQSYSYEDFIEGIKPKLTEPKEESETTDVQYHIGKGVFKEMVDKAIANSDKSFAIFIDEINRGNIANIFGELITLIEENKRLGSKEQLEVILPYSKERFGVPANLYIIGTMNTADRSVEALDTALRRRFSFIEIIPEPQKLAEPQFKCEGIELNRLLEALNERIELLLDKDYCIGHSYFMNIHNKENPTIELRALFQNKVIPLLQEYFYGDWGKIQLILGRGFVTKKVSKVKFLAVEDNEEYQDYDEKSIYSFTNVNSWDLDTFRSIYE